jgi:hypothetical protein
MPDRRLKKRGTKNGKDVWTARVPLPRGADGNRRQHRFTFIGNKKDAEKTLVAELSALNNAEQGVESSSAPNGMILT